MVTLPDFIARQMPAQLAELVGSRRHPPYLDRHRAEAIVARVRLVSAAFAAFTLFWIVLDHLTLPSPLWMVMAGLRVVSAAVFTWLAVYSPRNPSRATALGWLGAMLANPVVFYVVAQALFIGHELPEVAMVNARLYAMLPFVVVAGLSVFPLTVIEGLIFAAPVLAMTTLGPIALGRFDWVDQLPTLWVLLLILGVYLMSGMIQLHYMMALLRRASHDALTGTLTRRSGNEIVELYFAAARQRGAPFAVAFLDIDNFKSVNDRFGHEAGDALLRDVAANLNRLLRRGDMVVRWGGEEFVLLLPDTDLPGARIVMKRIVQEWLGERPDGGPVTASIGVAEMLSDGVDDWPHLVDLADRRMYRAKHRGKAHCLLKDGEILPGAGPGAAAVENELVSA